MKGCLTVVGGLVAIVFLIGLALSFASTPQTPEERAARQAERAAQQQERSRKAEERKAEEEAAFAKLAEREEEFAGIIQELIKEGVFRSVRWGQVTRVEVRPLFYSMDFELKKQACEIVYALASIHLRGQMIIVLLIDAQNGQEVGQFDFSGLTMKR